LCPAATDTKTHSTLPARLIDVTYLACAAPSPTQHRDAHACISHAASEAVQGEVTGSSNEKGGERVQGTTLC
jgi:hypothetical protein